MRFASLSRADLLKRAGLAGAALAGAEVHLQRALAAREISATTTITVLEHQPARLRLLRVEIPRFEAAMATKGTPIKVNLVAGPTNDNAFQTNLTVAYTSGTGPDVTSFPTSLTPDYVLANFIEDLSPFTRAWPDWQHAWYPAMRAAAQVNGRTYVIPREATVYSLFFRKDILLANRIPTNQPKTWNDLLAVAREIKRKTGKFALNIPAGLKWGAGTFDEGFIHLMLGSGSRFYNEQTRRWVVRSAGLLKVFQFYRTAAAEGLLPVKWLNTDNPWVATKYQGFPRGDLVITTSGTWSWEFDWGASGAAPIPDLFHKVATWPFPSVDGKPFTTGGVGWVWAVASRGAHAAASWEFVKFMTSGRALADNLVAIGAVSPRTDIAASQREYGRLPFLVDAEHTLTTSRTFVPRPLEAVIQGFVEQATQQLIDGRATPDQAMAAFAARAGQVLGPNVVEEE